MNYHIGTMLIDENFTESCDCPLCRIKATVDGRLTESYLGEGVMEDNTRAEVNKLGFCDHHYSLLFSSRSKLGLALQISTRLNTVLKEIKQPKNAKEAKKQGEAILNLNKTCVVCKYLDEHMIRYYKTVAQVYQNVASFKDRLLKTHGFCLSHYAELLTYSSFAGGKQKEYLQDLYEVQSKRVKTLKTDIDEFTFHHDYRQASTPLSQGAKDSLKETSNLFYGDKFKI
ncbi:MAG: hypothetical protein IJC87_06605 [Clostridia bacterium]|nr:hypothetical protein [Clostridia bacterium]